MQKIEQVIKNAMQMLALFIILFFIKLTTYKIFKTGK